MHGPHNVHKTGQEGRIAVQSSANSFAVEDRSLNEGRLQHHGRSAPLSSKSGSLPFSWGARFKAGQAANHSAGPHRAPLSAEHDDGCQRLILPKLQAVGAAGRLWVPEAGPAGGGVAAQLQAKLHPLRAAWR